VDSNNSWVLSRSQRSGEPRFLGMVWMFSGLLIVL
jgi:hypothetical protein